MRFMAVAAVLSAVIGGAAGNVDGQGPPAAEKFVLSGVIFFDGWSGLAWLQEPTLTGNQVVAVPQGGTVGQYRLTRILADRVELEGPAGKILVPIHNVRGAAGPAVASAAPAAPVSPPGAGAAPVAAAVSQPPGSSRLGPEVPKDAGVQQTTGVQEKVGHQEEHQQQARAPEPGPTNPFANNPSVRFFPSGDPRRMEGFQAILGGR